MKNALFFILIFFPAVAWGAFLNIGDGTITDTTTNLIWEQYGNEIYYSSIELAEGRITELNSAVDGDPWRIPTKTEIIGIKDYLFSVYSLYSLENYWTYNDGEPAPLAILLQDCSGEFCVFVSYGGTPVFNWPSSVGSARVLAVRDPIDSDSDGDGVSDSEDICQGHDDTVDIDSDGIPDGCDETIDPETSKQDFDYEAYLSANPDLPSIWGKAECMNHYKLYGFAENRAVAFNLEEYLNANPDFPRSWTYAEALNHYNMYGKFEGRILAFDAQEYLSLYADLPQNWTHEEAFAHYANYGRQEGRVASFDETAYLELYEDLPRSWGQAEAFYHYQYYGQYEGRVYDPYDESVFGPGYYDGDNTASSLIEDALAILNKNVSSAESHGITVDSFHLNGHFVGCAEYEEVGRDSLESFIESETDFALCGTQLGSDNPLCIFPGDDAIRSVESSTDQTHPNARQEIIDIPFSSGHVVTTLSYEDNDFEYEFSAKNNATACDTDTVFSTTSFVATDIAGDYSATVFSIDSNGVPITEAIGIMNCSSGSCSGVVSISSLEPYYTNFSSSSESWTGYLTFDGEEYDLIATLSPDKMVANFVAMPIDATDPIDFSESSLFIGAYK